MHIGVLGIGRIGAFHARTLADHDLVDTVTVWDPRPEAIAAARDQLAVRAADSPDQLFGDNLDAVLICSSSVTHVELLTEAVRRGVPAFCEKPLATSLAETRQLVSAVDAARAKVTVGFQRRSDPAYRQLKAGIDAGELGTLYLARLVVGDDAPPSAGYLAGSGGLFVDQSVHDFDILRHLTGQEVVEVYATGTALTGADGFADDADTAVTVLKLSNGMLASLTSSRHSAGGYDVRLEIAGSKGIRAVGLAASATEAGQATEVTMPAGGFIPRFAAAYRAEIARFLEFLEDRADNPCSVHDALAALEIAVAATDSRRTGRPVRVGSAAGLAAHG